MVGSGSFAKEDIFVVADADSCKPLERWALSRGIDVSAVINTGRTGARGGL